MKAKDKLSQLVNRQAVNPYEDAAEDIKIDAKEEQKLQSSTAKKTTFDSMITIHENTVDFTKESKTEDKGWTKANKSYTLM